MNLGQFLAYKGNLLVEGVSNHLHLYDIHLYDRCVCGNCSINGTLEINFPFLRILPLSLSYYFHGTWKTIKSIASINSI